MASVTGLPAKVDSAGKLHERSVRHRHHSELPLTLGCSMETRTKRQGEDLIPCSGRTEIRSVSRLHCFATQVFLLAGRKKILDVRRSWPSPRSIYICRDFAQTNLMPPSDRKLIKGTDLLVEQGSALIPYRGTLGGNLSPERLPGG